MEDIAIYREGRRVGTLRRYSEGLYTVFEARLPPQEGLQRLYVFGGGRRFCLGVMEPGPEGLSLRRRYSRAELKRLPAPIAYAALRPEEGAPTVGETPPGPRFLTLEGRLYLALPCALRYKRPGLRLYSENGREYLLFLWNLCL